MDQSYAVKYRELYERHWWWRSRESFILQKLHAAMEAMPIAEQSPRRILDVGCGDGLFFDKLQSLGTVTGVEGDPRTMSAGGKWRNQIYCGWFDYQFRPQNKFDAILMLDILEHMPDPLAALKHARSLLHDHGVLIATVPAFMSLWTSHDDLNHHVMRYTRNFFDPLVRDGGFAIVESRYLFHWTCPAKLAIRLKEKWFGAKPASPTVPATWINHVCYALSRIEQATLSKLPMPFGSSLLAVASPKVIVANDRKIRVKTKSR